MSTRKEYVVPVEIFITYDISEVQSGTDDGQSGTGTPYSLGLLTTYKNLKISLASSFDWLLLSFSQLELVWKISFSLSNGAMVFMRFGVAVALITTAATINAAPFLGQIVEREDQLLDEYSYVIIGAGTAVGFLIAL